MPGFTNSYTIDDVKESVKAMLEVCVTLDDPTPWITGVSGILWAIAGGHPNQCSTSQVIRVGNLR